MGEDFSQRLEDVEETIHARLRMQQDCIGNLQNMIHVNEIFELAFQCRRFEVNQHHVAEVMPVLLKSGQSASREEAAEEMKDCRPTVNP
ncbi:hypothetical protein DY000_02021533 [Brassica cretica]|uniref:DOG1 domain-containing protein n=1 Tax=Brassica cretica TaxID=69181 RepID=A0ABQ7ELA4_BRACR|nr:hypothetical protein DY000_02021533 [Brassica cretica]